MDGFRKGSHSAPADGDRFLERDPHVRNPLNLPNRKVEFRARDLDLRLAGPTFGRHLSLARPRRPALMMRLTQLSTYRRPFAAMLGILPTPAS